MARARGGVFLKWAGGKARLLPHLRALAPAGFARYHEPFLGAGALFFDLASAARIGGEAELSDVNADLVLAFQMVRDRTTALIALLHELKAAHGKASYYAARERFNAGELGKVDRAAHLIYLNKTGFNGLYRVNSRGVYNVPFGKYKDPAVCIEEDLREAATHLKRATIETRSFETVLDRARRGDFAYFDPPYDPLTRTASFTSYAAGGFGEDRQAQLAAVFRDLDERGVAVLLSNHDTPLVRRLYAGYERRAVRMTRQINSNIARRSDAVPEVIVLGHTLRAALPADRAGGART